MEPQGALGPTGISGDLSNLDASESKTSTSNWKADESSTLSPRAKFKASNINDDGYVEYIDPTLINNAEKVNIVCRRYLVQREKKGDEGSAHACQRGLAHLKTVLSSKELIEGNPLPPRETRLSNVVLIDMNIKNDVHTYCLWKESDSYYRIFDPSNHTFSNEIPKLISDKTIKIDVEAFTGDKFYQKSGTIRNTPSKDNAHNHDRDDRDCIDIALKVAFCFMWYQRTSFQLNDVLQGVRQLSNQPKVNPQLIHPMRMSSSIGSFKVLIKLYARPQ